MFQACDLDAYARLLASYVVIEPVVISSESMKDKRPVRLRGINQMKIRQEQRVR